jgi:carboxyl-terminal processing protease
MIVGTRSCSVLAKAFFLASGRGAAMLVALLAGCAAPPPPPLDVSPAEEHTLFIETNREIAEYHINKVVPDALDLAGLDRLTRLDAGLVIEHRGDELSLRYGKVVRRFPVPSATDSPAWGGLAASVVETARSLSPVIAEIPADRLDEMILDASLASLDRYSRYARPEIARARRAARDGFGGIGVTLERVEANVRIASILPDTPAALAGLRVGDRIVALDGVPIADLGLEQVQHQLRGPEQTSIQLAVARRGHTVPLEVSMLRTKIIPETVTLTEEDGIAWFKLRYFNQRTARSLDALLRQAHRDLGLGLRGIVLDLRDNPGGLLDQAVDVASIFLDGGEVASTVGRNPLSMQRFAAIASRHTETLPVAVLINGGSASASEIVASAIQDSHRGVVIGTSSYGKGTVQTVLRTSNGGELTVTWARLITPNGYVLDTHGVVPTLCTAGLSGAQGADTLLRRAPSPVPTALAVRRATLDDAGWKKLRARCPSERSVRKVDRIVATRLLADPALYDAVLRSPARRYVAATP